MPEKIVLPDGTKLTVYARLGCALGHDSEVVKHGNHDQSSHGNWSRGGVSLDRDIASRTASGGSTTDVSYDERGRRRTIDGGKIVSPYPERSKEFTSPMNVTATAAAVNAYRRVNADLLAEPQNALGTWIDPDTNHLWLDVVTAVKTHEEAVRVAQAHNQIAYYDADTGKVVNTGGTGIAKRRLGRRRLRRRDRSGNRSSTAGGFDPFGFGRVAKHGSHDQSSHGNWARVSGAGIDPDTVPEKYRKSMERKAAKLGITPEMLDAELRDAVERGSLDHDGWYETISERAAEMGEQHGVGLDTAAGVIAAISPAREFGKNMRDAATILDVIGKDEPFTPSQDDVDVYNEKRPSNRPIARVESMVPSQTDATLLATLHPRLSSLANITGFRDPIKAIEIARGGNIDAILGGPKVRSFASNIANPQGNRVTIDTWMYRAMTPDDHVFADGKRFQGTLDQIEANGYRTQDLYQSSPGGLVGTGIPSGVGLYPMFVESTQRVAAEYGMTPNDIQAIAWESERVKAGYKATDLGDYQ